MSNSSTTTNQRITFARSPRGLPVPEDFGRDVTPIPTVGEGQVLSRTLWLSLDPYYRNVMKNSQIYADRLAAGDVMVGETVAEVLESRHPQFTAGDIVAVRNGWQQYALSNGVGVRKIDPTLAPVSTALGVLGMPGLTGYAGTVYLGQPLPGQTFVVSACTGPVGSTAGQVAKHMGARVVGIAGSTEKCDYAIKEMGFDACVNYKDGDLAAALKAACPRGIDVYFDNVAGDTLVAVLRNLAIGARIVLCDPHRAIVSGPTRLRGSTVESPDIRAGMAMLLAALCADGTSVINNAQQIERGYEHIESRLGALGARIRRVELSAR